MQGSDGRELEGPQELGRRGDWGVHGCAKGCVHLRLGTVSHRFTPAEWRLLVEMCVEAAMRLEARSALSTPRH